MIKKSFWQWTAAIFGIAVLVGGCLPEDFIGFSQDGSLGVVKQGEAIYLVDGASGKLTEIDKGDISLHPSISNDGKFITYGKRVEYSSLDALLDDLGENQRKMLDHSLKFLREAVLSLGMDKRKKYPGFEEDPLLHSDSGQEELVMRYLCEKADAELKQKIPPKDIFDRSFRPVFGGHSTNFTTSGTGMSTAERAASTALPAPLLPPASSGIISAGGRSGY